MNKEKVYHVEFMEYTNAVKDTVAKYTDVPNSTIPHAEYLNVGVEPFLVKESDIQKYKDFGKGYKVLMFVGYIEV